MKLSKEQQLIKDTACQIVAKAVIPFVDEWEANHHIPLPRLKPLADAGLMGMMIPSVWGGAEVDLLSFALAIIEIAKGNGGLSTLLSVHNTVVSLPIIHYGTDDQQNTFLPALARGDMLGAFCLTEPDAGSDAAALKTTAVKKDQGYVINGVKQFITAGNQAQIAIVFAKTAKEQGKNGISAFIVPTDTPGFHVAKLEHKMGQHSVAIAQIVLENVYVPEKYLLGNENQGYKIALSHLSAGRIGIAAQAIGLAEKALELSTQYAKQRKTFGVLLADHQAIQFKLADMATQLMAAKSLLYQATEQPADRQLIAMTKLYATECAENICHQAIQIHGGYGYLEEFPVARLYRDVRACTLYEGTSEIQRLIIAKQLLI